MKRSGNLSPPTSWRMGTFVWAIDPLFLQPFSRGIDQIWLVCEGTREEEWARQFLDQDRLLTYRLAPSCPCPFAGLNTELVLLHSDLAEVLGRHGVNALFITNHCTPGILSWAETHSMRLVTSDPHLQRSLENKIWFDRFLRENRLPVPDGDVYRFPGPLPVQGRSVLQDPEGSGSEGTYFIRDLQDIEDKVGKGMVQQGKEYLLRKFVSGRSLGITVFISSNTIALSALRLQCFEKNRTGHTRSFTGIQWLSHERFSVLARRRIERTFLRLGTLFHGAGFLGYASFDFILDRRDDVHIIECNPRPGSATSHLLAFPDLISGLPTGNLFAEECLRPRPFRKAPVQMGLPRTDFEGSCYEIQISPSGEPFRNLGRNWGRNGLYQCRGSRIKFLTPDLRHFSLREPQFSFYHGAQPGDLYTEKTLIGYVLSNVRLYRSTGELNKLGQSILSQVLCHYDS